MYSPLLLSLLYISRTEVDVLTTIPLFALHQQNRGGCTHHHSSLCSTSIEQRWMYSPPFLSLLYINMTDLDVLTTIPLFALHQQNRGGCTHHYSSLCSTSIEQRWMYSPPLSLLYINRKEVDVLTTIHLFALHQQNRGGCTHHHSSLCSTSIEQWWMYSPPFISLLYINRKEVDVLTTIHL